MSSSEFGLPAAIESALQKMVEAIETANLIVVQNLQTQASAALRPADRDLRANAASDLKLRNGEFLLNFRQNLRASALKDLGVTASPRHRVSNFSALDLVGDDKVQEGVLAASIAQQIQAGCEAELQEIGQYISAALKLNRVDESRIPVRAPSIAAALSAALVTVSREKDLRQLLAQEMGRTLAQRLKDTYRAITAQLRADGFRPIPLSIAGVSASDKRSSPLTQAAEVSFSGPTALPPVVSEAIRFIGIDAEKAAESIAQSLMEQSTKTTRIFERDNLTNASLALRKGLSEFVSNFTQSLRNDALQDLQPRKSAGLQATDSDWMSMSLVDDQKVDEQVFANRIGNALSHGCEAELRELVVYLGAILEVVRTDESRNPIRPGNVGKSIYVAISGLTQDVELRKVLATEFSRAMSKALGRSYVQIREMLQAQGIQPVGFTVKSTSAAAGRIATRPAPLTDSPAAPLTPSTSSPAVAPTSPAPLAADAPIKGTIALGAAVTSGSISSTDGASNPLANPQLMTLLRHLTQISLPADLTGTSQFSDSQKRADPPESAAEGTDAAPPANLIRAHRQELIKASTGHLDHMLIDLVAGLFDQILSDPKVPPQMARLIARLQMPVLRVALSDDSFFSSRKHPVRRLVNRIGSLACAFEDFNAGPGEQILHRVRDLVQEIVEGEFDQIDLYHQKLAELESFVSDLSQQETEATGAVNLLANKESELRTQQRYMQQLWSALKTFDMPAYLREFICQVWSQAIVMAYRRSGPQDPQTVRIRKAGRDVILSVLPKGSAELRKRFIMELPVLMKSLKEGMQLIGWPDQAQENFFGDLLPSHAHSLKQTPLRELDYNLLARELDSIFEAPIPGLGAPAASVAEAAAVSGETIERMFSPQEAQQVGLLDEAAVDWSDEVDINLSEPGESPDQDGWQTVPPVSGVNIPTLTVGIVPEEPAPPVEGPELIEHLEVGHAYMMHLQDQWKKVRLSFISPGHTFFVFTHGLHQREVISITARMLSRMCESGRLRAAESADLMERATLKVQEQLSASRTAPL